MAAQNRTKMKRVEKLAAALEAYLKSITEKEGRELGPEWGEGGKYNSVADSGVWTGEKIATHAPGGADVVLHYDGAGNDRFGYNSDGVAYYGCYQDRNAVEALGKKYGFFMEDLNSWSMGFYYEG